MTTRPMRRHLKLLLGFALLATLAVACGDDNASSTDAPSPRATPLTSTVQTTDEGPEPTSAQASGALSYEIVSERPHDPTAWTQGLVFDADGRLYESTGYEMPVEGSVTSVRELDPTSGAVINQVEFGYDHFGEGLAAVDDRLIQITWLDEVAFVFDRHSLDQIGTHRYAGQGWGLCYDGSQLVMSDGSSTLAFRDAESFALTSSIAVSRRDGREVGRLNELECVDGQVWANQWKSDELLRIDPTTGEVTATLDLAAISAAQDVDVAAGAVLNGIAHNPETGTFYITGKLWPTMVEIAISAR